MLYFEVKIKSEKYENLEKEMSELKIKYEEILKATQSKETDYL